MVDSNFHPMFCVDLAILCLACSESTIENSLVLAIFRTKTRHFFAHSRRKNCWNSMQRGWHAQALLGVSVHVMKPKNCLQLMNTLYRCCHLKICPSSICQRAAKVICADAALVGYMALRHRKKILSYRNHRPYHTEQLVATHHCAGMALRAHDTASFEVLITIPNSTKLLHLGLLHLLNIVKYDRYLKGHLSISIFTKIVFPIWIF